MPKNKKKPQTPENKKVKDSVHMFRLFNPPENGSWREEQKKEQRFENLKRCPGIWLLKPGYGLPSSGACIAARTSGREGIS